MNGTDLLAEFRKSRAEGAFGELVRRYTNLVFSVAKRRLSNVAQAQEVTQTVFIRLAKAAPDLRGDAELVAWLHRTTVHASIDLWRSEIRRRTREEHAAAMQPEHTEDAAWSEIAPVLDEALNELNDGERQVILLRFFEQKTMRDLGLALGISEDAAKMRVSRAMDRLRALFGERGLACGAAALGTLLTERSVEAAPAGLVIAPAALRIPAAAGLGAGAYIAGLLAQASRAKLGAGVAAALIVGAAITIWLISATSGHRVPAADAGQMARSNPMPAGGGGAAASASADTNGVAGAEAPDPLKLLQAVVRARQRIDSGSMEFEAHFYGAESTRKDTNFERLKVIFDGEKRRFEQSGPRYRYVVPAAEAQAAEAKGLGRQEMLEAGLVEEFQARIVSIYDGEALLKYRESGGAAHGSTVIDDPAKGSGEYVFDPRCFGLDSALSVRTTIESLRQFYSEAKSTRLAGKEFVEGNPAWHVQMFSKHDQSLDFWIDVAHPQRVVRHTDGRSEVLSRFDDATPKDPLPVQVAVTRYGPAGYQRLITRSNTRLNVPVAPASFTLAGLGMPAGTDVVDVRIHRGIGYWTGTGLAENPPRRTGESQAPPDLAALLSVLERDPGSEAALDAAQWILLNTQDGPEVEKAAAVILQDHIGDASLAPLCQEMERLRHRCSRSLLEALLERNPSDVVRGNACLALALLRKDEAKYGENQQAAAEAERLFERVIGQFGAVKRNEGRMLADVAKPELSELRKLFIGKPAPKTEGEDLDGRPLKLSDCRGKVVLLVFWVSKWPPNVPDLVKLLDRLKGKPFAILGVYCDSDPAWGKDVAEESGMTWPSFRDGRLGPIQTAWHNPGWPVFHIVDGQGISRRRNVAPEHNVTAAVEAVMGK